MERRFFVEAKSFFYFLFSSVVNGLDELRVVEKRKGFSGFVLLGLRYAAWLVSLVEEVLHNIVFEDFVKSFREGSKVTIVRRGGNRFGRFLEVAVYVVDGQRGMTLFPEGWDVRGWSCVFGELSKALAFLEAMVKAPSSCGTPVGKFLGKVAGPLSFLEVAIGEG
jgi:hypothetical protein